MRLLRKRLVLAVPALSLLLARDLPGQLVTFTHFAGSPGGASTEDGVGTLARFNTPLGVAVDGAGAIYVTDAGNHTVRKVVPGGQVTTLAGLAGSSGGDDGKGSSARFDTPDGIVLDATGNLYLTDHGSHTIRKITPAGAVSTFAGAAGAAGSADGAGAAARFQSPAGLARDAAGNLYVADSGNQTIRKITPQGVVSTVAGTPGAVGDADGTGAAARFQNPSGVAVDPAGNIFVADTSNHSIRKITPGGVVTTFAGDPGTAGDDDGLGSAAHFRYPGRIVADAAGNLYVADTENDTIRKITPAGAVSTLAGLAGKTGAADGLRSAARFLEPNGLAVDAGGNVTVADTGNHTVRRITAEGAVATPAGVGIIVGAADGTGADAQFNNPSSVAVDGAGRVYLVDTNNHTVRKITTSGTASTLAGNAGFAGSSDGLPSIARFRSPAGIAVDGSGNLFVADTGNHTIRKVALDGTVSTLAGKSGSPGAVDDTGDAARFSSPRGVAVDGIGNVFVADTGNHAIRKITPAGEVTTFAGKLGTKGSTDGTGTGAKFSGPQGIAATAAGTLYVADTGNHTIRKITNTGIVTTLAGVAGQRGVVGTDREARFNVPSGLTVDAGGNVFVADTGNNMIRKVRPGGSVSTMGGAPDLGGASTDGIGDDSRFNGPRGVAVDSNGRVFVADTLNNTIRRGLPTLSDKALIDAESGPVGETRKLDTIPQTASSWQWTVVRRPAGSVAAFSNPQVRNPTFTPDVAELYVIRLFATGVNGTLASLSTVTLVGCGSTAAPPVITRTSGHQPSCPGEPVTLDAGAGYSSYLWSTGETTRTITVSPITEATYAVTVKDAAACDTATGMYTQVVASPLSAVEISISGTAAGCTSADGLVASAADTGGGTNAHQWGYRVVSGGATTPIAGQTDATYTIRPADFPAPGAYFLVTTTTPSCGTPITSNELPIRVGTGGTSRLVPIVLDVSTGSAHFTSELAITNRGAAEVAVSLTYTAALGARAGSGTVGDSLPAGRQLVIPRVLDYLRGKGLPIPAAASDPQQGGTLLVRFLNLNDPSVVAVTARTTAATAAPQPVGAAGLAYPGLGPCDGFTGTAYLYGLRTTTEDRANVAVFNASADPVIVKISVVSGSGDGRVVIVRPAEAIPGYGWLQVSRILDNTGITNGYAVIERVSGTGVFGAYAVINDNATNDGSFIAPVSSGVAGGALTVPVLVEIKEPRFRSELVLTNRGAAPATFTLRYVESLTPSLGTGGTLTLTLAAGEQRIFPNAIDYLRSFAGGIGAADAASYAGALRVSVEGVPLSEVFAGARTTAVSPAGGFFGLFTPGVYPGDDASGEAFVYGLRADVDNRSNVAVVNVGTDVDGNVLLELQAFDGDAQGAPKGTPVTVALEPGHWAQIGNFLKTAGVANGWVRVRRLSGTAPWIAYGVVNDGGVPGQRTGDGAYVPMSR